ncbi:MAG: formyltetrahydrofolate deformylase [Candidatus Schekmanbacteria bacterium RBG_16_38_10]|uniref:Formyltetrahydrofolate deformylase n=1 Tax=Candidatus Schekmanbacteria bacterium RBG_16_38_10 TaxID=1817879 RepID=A0A1F7RR22_9BACT|nr:MAG: formyltetrahydrofolate deformylase [Candidatus Schekmanbacteria bacterium RBG_16_38_10]
MLQEKISKVVLLVSCPDRKGIVAGISNFIYSLGGNILRSDQYTTDPLDGVFFLRIEFDFLDTALSRDELEHEFEKLAVPFNMDWKMMYAKDTKRMAIMASRQGHCLVDLLWRWKTGDLRSEIQFVISNHPDLQKTVESFGIPFYLFPVTPITRRQQEDDILKLLNGNVDVIVLARYMQILSNEFISRYPNRIINIHHSFLPAFIGANPYEQALNRGVKIIGATAHFVTDKLDEGPIIEQDVIRVTHRDGLSDLILKGRDLEKTVLARAVRWYLEDRILAYHNRTVVFE